MSDGITIDYYTDGPCMWAWISQPHLQSARQQHRRGSPIRALREGRQVLFGNVGYRILHANLEELLCTDAGGASWCCGSLPATDT